MKIAFSDMLLFNIRFKLVYYKLHMQSDKGRSKSLFFCLTLVSPTEYISLKEMKQGQCICPLSWSVHCNYFTGDGKCNKSGWACTPHPHQPGPILPSALNVRQKAAVATLCTLWSHLSKSPVLADGPAALLAA
jgi:hypothetical protein